MNVELINKIENQIINDPDSILMGTWIATSKKSLCGSVGCISGWACVLDNRLPDHQLKYPSLIYRFDFQTVGADALKIDLEKSSKLFYVNEWPEEFITQCIDKYPEYFDSYSEFVEYFPLGSFFEDEFDIAPTKIQAQIVFDRLEYLKATGE